MVLKTNGSLMKVKSIAECSCNTFDLYYGIIGLDSQFCLLFEWPLTTGVTVVLSLFLSCFRVDIDRFVPGRSYGRYRYFSSPDTCV